VSSGGTSDASNKSIASSGGPPGLHVHGGRGGHSECNTPHLRHYPGGVRGAESAGRTSLPASTTLPRSSKRPTAVPSQPLYVKEVQYHRPQYHTTSRSISRESGSSSSRTASRSGSRSGMAKITTSSRSGSSSALHPLRSRSRTPEGTVQIH
jgi:hypothetical protein